MSNPSEVLVPAAVSPLVAGAVAGTERACRVLAAFPTCLYLGLGGHADVLAVLASDAIVLPIGLRLAEPSGSVRWGVQAGDTVLVGAGRVRLPHAHLVAARLSRPARVRPGGLLAGAAGRLPEPGLLGELVRELVVAAVSGRPVEPAVRGLVGAGRGLTPSGDDALCGGLLALVAASGGCADVARALSRVRAAVRDASMRTTSLSAALLLASGAGFGTPEVTRLVASLQVGADASSDASSDDLLAPVLAIGHSSGRDLVSGLAGALLALEVSDHPAAPESSLSATPTAFTERGSRSA